MAITYNLLLDADFAPLEAVGAAWLKLYQDMGEQASTLVELKSNDGSAFGVNHWDGESGEAARERVHDIVVGLDERSSAARRVSVAIADAVDEFKGAQTDLNDVIAEIDTERVALTDAGSVIPNTSTGTDNIYYAEGLSARITAAVQRATEADEALKAAIGTWAETFSESERLAMIAQADDEASELQELIDSGASPQQINGWWNELSEAERLGILEGNPALIAGVDGIPTDTRDAANRTLLEAEINRYSPTLDGDIAAIEAQLAEMEANGDQYVYNEGNLGVPHQSSEYSELAAQLEELKAQRDDRDALLSLQEGTAGTAVTGQDYYLLGYDKGDNGGAIVSIGNPDTATNTGVFVPGTFANLDNFTGTDGALDRAEIMAQDAQRLGIAGEETAMIAWMDYDTPQATSPIAEASWDELSFQNPEAFWPGAAEEGGVTLSHFVDGLDATHADGGANTSLIGHSYGTTVAGEAAQDSDTGADQLIGVASPGFNVEHVSQLAIDADHVWATSAEGDAIQQVPDWDIALGTDPTEQGTVMTGFGDDAERHDGFGANVFTSQAEPGASGNEIHGGYWGEIDDNPNIARDNIAYIITGQPDYVKLVEE